MGRIYRALRLNNSDKTFDVVAFVDTGSDRTVISEKIAKKLDLKARSREKIQVANKEITDTWITKVRVISTLDEIDSIIRVAVTDLPFEMEPDENINMIIGLDFLQKHNVKLFSRNED